MATLDRLLRAVVDHRMDALVLEPGRLPRLCQNGDQREVTKTRLDGTIIRHLVAEVSEEPVPDPVAGTGWEFEYRLDGTAFRFRGEPGPEGWRLRAEPMAPSDRKAEPTAEPVVETEPPSGADAAADPTAEPVAEAAPPASSPAAMDDLLTRMIEMGASDLHLSPGQPIRLRLDGDLTPFGSEVPDAARTRELILSIAPECRREEFERESDADFAYEIPGLARFRVNLFRDRQGAGAVLRQIPERIPSADDLGLPPAVRRLAHLPKGLVLVTGPTGSGKSTTLAALVDLVNRTRPDHIITIEDPIEFVHPSKRCMINQREVGEHTRSFARALRAALREDPDVVLVGEMRDLETTSIAIETAETGHLVLGTLHTTSAVGTIERLVNQFPADRQEQVRLMLADSLRAVVSQILLKRVGGGRVAAQEILVVNRAVSNLIRENKTYQIPSIMQTTKKQGNVVLNEALLHLVLAEAVEAREAYMKAIDKDDLLGRMRTEGVDVELVGRVDLEGQE
jgi:twitching motility protein PilT